MASIGATFPRSAKRVRPTRALRLCFIAAVWLGAVAMPAAAQLESASIGQRVRVQIRDAHRQAAFAPARLDLRGTLSALDSSSLTLQLLADGAPVTIPRSEMLSLAVSRGVPGRPESALRGAVGGAFLGVLWGFVYYHSPDRDRGNTWEDAIGTGAAVGAVAGAVFGALSPHERWKRLRLR